MIMIYYLDTAVGGSEPIYGNRHLPENAGGIEVGMVKS